MKKLIVESCILLFLIYNIPSSARPGGGSSYRGSSSSSSGRSSSSSSYKSSSSSSSYRSSSSTTTGSSYHRTGSNTSPSNHSNVSKPDPVQTALASNDSQYEVKKYKTFLKLNRDAGLEIRESMKADFSVLHFGFIYRTLDGYTESDKGKEKKVFDLERKYSITPVNLETKLESSDELHDFGRAGLNLRTKFYTVKRLLAGGNSAEFSLYRKSYGHILNDKGQSYILYPVSPLSGKTSSLKEIEAEVELPAGFEFKDVQVLDSETMEPALVPEKTILKVGNTLSLKMNTVSLKNPVLLKLSVPPESFDDSLIPEEVFSESVNVTVSESEIRLFFSKDGVFSVSDSFQAKKANSSSYGSVLYRMAEDEPLLKNQYPQFPKQFFFDVEFSPKDMSYYSSSYYKSITDSFLSDKLKKYEVRHRLFGNFYAESGKNHYIYTAPYTEKNAVRKTRIVLDFEEGLNLSDFEISAERKSGTVRKEISGKSVIFNYGLDLGDDPALVRISVSSEKISGLSFSNRMKIWNEDGTFIVFGFSSAVILLFGFIAYRVRKYFISRKTSAQNELNLKQSELLSKMSILKSNDPLFDENEFLEKVKRTYAKLTFAWISGNMKPARSIVSAGVFGRFRTQLAIMKEDGIVNLMKDWKIRDLKIISVQSSENLFTIDVQLSAEARDVNVQTSLSREEKEKLLNSADLSQYTEIWSFIRGKNAKTKNQSGILFENCPKCGSPSDNSTNVNKCASCGTVYNSGEYDWVLSEITQEEEWKTEDRNPPGFSEIQKLMPDISIQLIEDRASHLFWKWIEARRKGDSLPARRFSTESFLERRFLKPEYISDPVIGAAVLHSCRIEDGKIHCRVFIQWSASFAKESESIYQEVNLVLVKNVSSGAGVFGFAELGCPSCGAPLPESDSLKCVYCNSELPVQTGDWLLDSAM